MIETTSFAGDEHIGVYTRVFEDVAFVPLDATEEYISTVEKRLGVEVVQTTIQGCSIIGSLLAGNSSGMIVSGLASTEEINLLKKYGRVMLLERTMNAAGNIILANDYFAAVHPGISENTAEKISEFLEVPVLMMYIGRVPTVGMAGVATNKGVLLNPGTSKAEITEIEETSGLPTGTGTVNMGSTLIGTGLLANSKNYLAGNSTSGYELGRIEDVFGFLTE